MASICYPLPLRMFFQVVLRLDVALSVYLVACHLLAIRLDVSAPFPVAEHQRQRAASYPHTLAHGSGLLAGEDLGQQVEQVLRASVLLRAFPRNALQDNAPENSNFLSML